MRSLRTTLAAAWLVASATAFVSAQDAPKAKDLLVLKPVIKGVEYEIPADAGAIDACKIETVFNARKRGIGFALRDGQGKLLRRFVDTDGNGKTDQWSYFQDGFEVYRDNDLNGDLSPDESRWMNTAGTRTATILRGKIVGWKRISAEESSKVFVQGLVSGDLALIETVLATSEELASLGIPKGAIDQAAAAAGKRADAILALRNSLVGWTSKTIWNRLDASMPHLIPTDTEAGIPQDITLYENAVIFAGAPGARTDLEKVSFLQVPELIRVGETWKFIELPRAIDPAKPVMAAEGGLRTWIFRQQAGGESNNSPELAAALDALAKFDNANAKAQVQGEKKELAQFHVGRIPLLRAIVKAATKPEDVLVYNKQIVDSLAAAFQTGLYPNGIKLIDQVAKGEGPIASYAAFRRISAEFAIKNDEPGAQLMVNQKTWMADLKAYLSAFPNAEEAPDALIQLASASEFNAEEDDARKYYEDLSRKFPESDAGKKATGALRRLDLVGKTIDLRGPGLKGESIDAARYKGKTLLVTFWASWADPVRRDLPELLKLYQKYKGKDFEILGVNLDNERTDLDAFLKEYSLPWSQIFEPGGIEKSRFAADYGIIALPTMILADPQGKVVNRNIRSAAELERQLEKVLGAKPPGVAIER